MEKKRLREIDRRISFLSDRINNSILIDPKSVRFNGIYFGATVTILDAEGQERVYTIVGVDEIDVPGGKISWRSPLGALRCCIGVDGDLITYSTPQGKREVEILKFHYD
jgi:transcription elongation factor GreB